MENYANLYKEKLWVPDEAVKSAPWAMGEKQETIHISEVDYSVENSSPLPTTPTEIMVDSYLDLLKKGIITGAKKQIAQGKMVYIFALGSIMLYDYINRNLTNATYSVDI